MVLSLNIFLIVATILCFGSDFKNTLPLIPKNEKNRYEHGNSLFVFVGEKIEVKEMPYEEWSMDAGYKAKYKILQKVYGDYDKAIIEFEVYDHYGIPKFSKYKHVLLFVSEYILHSG